MRLRPYYFRRWLESFPAGHIVGYSWNPLHCPLSAWLRELYGEDRVWVTKESFRVNGRWRKHPRWMKLFVDKVDALSESPTPITKEMALAIFREVMKEERNAR